MCFQLRKQYKRKSLSTEDIKLDGLWFSYFSYKKTIKVKHRLAAHWSDHVLTACFTTQKIEKRLLLDSQTRGTVTEGSYFNTTVVHIPPERCPAITCNACSTSMNTTVSYQQQLLQRKPRGGEGVATSIFLQISMWTIYCCPGGTATPIVLISQLYRGCWGEQTSTHWMFISA